MSNNTSILIVDDDNAHRTMLSTLLEGWGYSVAEADDGSTAVDQVRQRGFDLVLMDNRMLKVSGMEALEQIKAINEAIPVIIMTAYSTIELSVAAMMIRNCFSQVKSFFPVFGILFKNMGEPLRKEWKN